MQSSLLSEFHSKSQFKRIVKLQRDSQLEKFSRKLNQNHRSRAKFLLLLNFLLVHQFFLLLLGLLIIPWNLLIFARQQVWYLRRFGTDARVCLCLKSGVYIFHSALHKKPIAKSSFDHSVAAVSEELVVQDRSQFLLPPQNFFSPELNLQLSWVQQQKHLISDLGDAEESGRTWRTFPLH